MCKIKSEICQIQFEIKKNKLTICENKSKQLKNKLNDISTHGILTRLVYTKQDKASVHDNNYYCIIDSFDVILCMMPDYM